MLPHLAPLPALASIQFLKEISPPVGPPGVVRPSGVGLATLALGGARVLFVACQAEEWSCHIFSSHFSSRVPLSEYVHSPRVSFSVVVGCLGSQEAVSLILEVPFPSVGGL